MFVAADETARAMARRSNFIFILTDDQRHDALGCAGNASIRTPHMDALAARGVRFENAFVTLSICSPCRAASLTGRYGSANGVTSVPGTINANERTIAHILRDAGYRTGMIGKWHLGNTPQQCGFDSATYFMSNGPYYGRSVIDNGVEKTAKGYIEKYNADRAIEFLKGSAHSAQPFFLFYCPQVPHMNHEFDWPAREETLALYDASEMPLPMTWQDDLAGKPPYLKDSRSRTQALRYGYDQAENLQRHRQRYYAAITEMDASLGRLLAALDDLGLDSNTYIFLMGDNGWFMGEHGFTSKVLPYEESIRVPMIVTGPGVRKGVNRHLVLNIDIAPTILGLAATMAEPKGMHGRNMIGLLRGRWVPWRRSFLYEAPTPSLGSWPLYAVRTDRWKYIQTFDKADRQRLAFEELYDLKTDPKETTNLAGQARHAKRQATLKAELNGLRARLDT
jgi:arylsulfatase A-like enzyme